MTAKLEFGQLKRNLKKPLTNMPVVRMALLCDFASQLLHVAIKGQGIQENVNYEIYEADFNQIEAEVFNPNSSLYEFNPEYIIILKSTEHFAEHFYAFDEKQNYHIEEAGQYQKYAEAIRSVTNARIIFNTYPERNDLVFGNYGAMENKSLITNLRKFNIGIGSLAAENAGVFILDMASILASEGILNGRDNNLYVSANLVYNLDVLPGIALNIHKIISSIRGQLKKCVVLDLDNTLWGGIIGDDGVEGIQVGGLGIGKAFTDFQNWLKQLKARGILLAVCSKNNEETAKEPFILHPEMVLRMDDFAIFVANWETKVDNINYIQSVLNIGFDSMVFLDDNPFEREMVKSAIADIEVPDLPEDPAEYLSYLQGLNLFETTSHTAEDEQRTQQYREEANRTTLKRTFKNEEEYLCSLGMLSKVEKFNKFNIPRVAQLSQRSNQFNLRTIRYSEESLIAISGDENYKTLAFSLKDKFGDSGLISFIILEKISEKTIFIDSWVMSCRVLKRTMEEFILENILMLASEFDILRAEYIPTKKNAMVENLYQNLGFNKVNEYWEMNIKENANTRRHFIETETI